MYKIQPVSRTTNFGAARPSFSRSCKSWGVTWKLKLSPFPSSKCCSAFTQFSQDLPPFYSLLQQVQPRSLSFITSKISTLKCLRITSLSKGYFFSPGLWTGACNKAIEVQAHPELTEQNSAPWLSPPVKHIQLSVDWPQMCILHIKQLHNCTI